MWKLFEFIKVSSVLIRQFCLPNPFAGFENGEVLNLVAGGVLYPLTYLVVGIYYEPGSSPIWGSLLYLFFYAVHAGLIALSGIFSFSIVSIIMTLILYILMLFGFKKLQQFVGWGEY